MDQGEAGRWLVPETLAERAARLAAGNTHAGESLSARAERLAAAQTPAPPSVRPDVTRNAPRADRGGDFQSTFSDLKGQGRVVRDEVLPGLAAHALNAVPVPNALLAVAGMAGSQFTNHPMGYGESRSALDDELGKIPGDLRAAEQIAAAGPEGAKALLKLGSRVPVKAVARAVLSPRKTAVRAIGNVLRDGFAEAKIPKAAAPEASPVVGSITPKAEGLIGNQFDNVVEAVKARESGAPSKVIEALKREPVSPKPGPQLGPKLPDVVKASERYRTESGALQRRGTDARFDHFADQFSKRRAAQTGPEMASDLAPDDLLALSLDHLNKGGTVGQLNALRARFFKP